MRINKKLKKQGTTIGIVLFFLIAGVWYFHRSGEPQTQNAADEMTGVVSSIEETVISEPEDADAKNQAMQEKEPEKEVVVHVCGAVNVPGVYVLPDSSRLYEAVAMAGGFCEGADTDYPNLARTVQDGERIYILSYEETSALTTEQKVAGDAGEQPRETLINLNTATVQQLTSLPGIGEAKAADILAYREKVGRFTAVEELKNISGIGDAMFERVKDKIMVK